jgi:ABC-type amino acid transport system permease subunit
MAAACNSMKKKNWLLLIIVLTAALLIAIVFWIYAKRIEHIENKMIRSGYHPIAFQHPPVLSI